VERQKDRELER
jgi:hypothetical protein